jgi:hypothetical protein
MSKNVLQPATLHYAQKSLVCERVNYTFETCNTVGVAGLRRALGFPSAGTGVAFVQKGLICGWYCFTVMTPRLASSEKRVVPGRFGIVSLFGNNLCTHLLRT